MKRLNMEPRFVKGIIIIFFIGLLGGVLIVNLLKESFLNQAGILSDYFIRQYKYLEIDSGELFCYILGKRLKWILLLWILGFTVIGLLAGGIFTLWMGFTTGTLLSIGVLKLGVRGILFCIGAVFPQGLIYIPAWLLLLYGIYQRSGGRLLERKGTGRKPELKYILLIVGICLFTILGILLESSINPWIVKLVLRFI